MVSRKRYTPEKGDIVWLDFTPQAGREQRGRRPALVVSATAYNRTGLMLACPITSKVKGYPFEVPLSAPPIHGCVLSDHVKNQDWKARDAEFITKAPDHVLKSVQQIIAALLIK
jgi:mRNA interferase MazF